MRVRKVTDGSDADLEGSVGVISRLGRKCKV